MENNNQTNETPLFEEALVAKEAQESGETEGACEEAPIDWQARCLAAESALGDSLAFASLWAPFSDPGAKIEDEPIYQRFLLLREKGLSVNEAFAAAGWDRKLVAKKEDAKPSKAHLFSGAPDHTIASSRLSYEEMALAKELLGDAYSHEEIEKLYRRVAKG